MLDPEWVGYPGARVIGEAEHKAVVDVLARRTLYRGAGLNEPREVSAVEVELARRLGRRFALTFNSGTSALVAGLVALGVGEGDEVIVPGYGWLTDVSAVLHLKAVPVLCPIGADLNIDPARIPECLTPRTKAITPVHACGRACDLDLVRAAAPGVSVLDDACQALGATSGGRPVGGEGTAATVLSFQSFKIITAGEGGALVTDDEELYVAAVRYHDAGLSRFAHAAASRGAPMQPIGVGLNLRMSELTAALLRVQLGRLEEVRAGQRAARERLSAAFAPAFEAGLLEEAPQGPGTEDNGTFLLLTARDGDAARGLHRALAALGVPLVHGIEDALHTSPGWAAYMQDQGFPFRSVGLEATRAILERTLFLQVNPDQSPESLDRLRRGIAGAVGATA